MGFQFLHEPHTSSLLIVPACARWWRDCIVWHLRWADWTSAEYEHGGGGCENFHAYVYTIPRLPGA